MDHNDLALQFERFNVRPLRIRTRHVADSVVDRLLEAAAAVNAQRDIKEPTDSSVSLIRCENGELIVPKTLVAVTCDTMTI